MKDLVEKYLGEVIKGKSSWSGIAGKKRIKMGQDKSGMYYGEIRDEFGDIESSTTARTQQDIMKWFEKDKKIAKIKWDK
jgi:hypothetical protein